MAQADTELIKNHLTAITKHENGYRNYRNLKVLNKVADYIFQEFQQYADSVYFQEFVADGQTYKNVVGVFNNHLPKTIVVGAHYDVCDNQEGADDNASGVVGVLELARMLCSENQQKKLKHRIEIVAYTLEEPPYYGTELMGSFVHAKSLKDKKVNVYGMVCLEMIGYFDDRPNSQAYPIGMMSWFYGNKGDFIGLVNHFNKGTFAKNFTAQFIKKQKIKTKKITAPKALQGIDFSDHRNYWHFGYSALMITDTAFYRNKNYHQKTDTMETLDIPKMAKVIDTVFEALVKM